MGDRPDTTLALSRKTSKYKVHMNLLLTVSCPHGSRFRCVCADIPQRSATLGIFSRGGPLLRSHLRYSHRTWRKAAPDEKRKEEVGQPDPIPTGHDGGM